jgi:phenylpropionate dioxygenase-like ring-hydroxylating dioxygenase large terminal subunit
VYVDNICGVQWPVTDWNSVREAHVQTFGMLPYVSSHANVNQQQQLFYTKLSNHDYDNSMILDFDGLILSNVKTNKK